MQSPYSYGVSVVSIINFRLPSADKYIILAFFFVAYQTWFVKEFCAGARRIALE